MKRILLIDDDLSQLRLLFILAKEAGIDADTCNQFDADVRDWSDYDLVIVDAMMPIIDGKTLIANARGKLGADFPPTILLSAMPLAALRNYARGVSPCVSLMTKSGSISDIKQQFRDFASV
jgi:DNA-binding response OmpR family regulator